jgi:hypothetical protein
VLKKKVSQLMPRRWMIVGILMISLLALILWLIPTEYGPVQVVLSAIVTWSILLVPPVVIRLAKGSPFSSASAALTCILLYFSYFLVFELLGSVNKGHFPILVGTFAAFYILRREKMVVEDEKFADNIGDKPSHAATLKQEPSKPLLDPNLFDLELKKKIILIAVTASLVALGYYFFSPYENCLRKYRGVSERVIERCSEKTDW